MYVSWKGKTFSQITANVRTKIIDYKYTTDDENIPIMPNSFIMKSQPLKIYRKEIASVPLNTCNHRTSIKISDLMETPGGNIVNSIEPNKLTNGLVNINDPNLPNLKGD